MFVLGTDPPNQRHAVPIDEACVGLEAGHESLIEDVPSHEPPLAFCCAHRSFFEETSNEVAREQEVVSCGFEVARAHSAFSRARW